MPFTIPIALFGWVPLSLALFAVLPSRKALLTSYILGWLILPTVSLDLPGLPNYSKATAVSYGVLLGTSLFAGHRVLSFRPIWIDIPILFYVLCPIPSSLTNDLGIYDGLSSALTQFLMAGVPYLMGRVYLRTLDDAKAFTLAVFIGGLCYIPPCLFELKMSPQIARYVYGLGGFTPDMLRFGGYRPVVLLTSGLELGMWMTAASFLGWVLWRGRLHHQVFGLPLGIALTTLFAITVLCRSSGALFLLILGMFTFWFSRRSRASLLVLAVLLAPPLFETVRSTGAWKGTELCDWLARNFDPDRAQSLQYRFDNEDQYINRAWEQPVFGWGGFNRHQVRGDDGRIVTINDSHWIIIFGQHGFVGIVAWSLAIVLPGLVFLHGHPARTWSDTNVALMASIMLLVQLYMFDCLVNYQYNPIYLVGLGGVATFARAPLTTHAMAPSQGGPLGWPSLQAPRSVIEYRQAIGALEMALGAAPEDTARRRELALAYESFARFLVEQGQVDDAEHVWTRAVELLDELANGPGWMDHWQLAAVRNDMAWSLVTAPGATQAHWRRARDWSQEATRLAPHHAAFWNTLALVYYRLGEWRKAISILKRTTGPEFDLSSYDEMVLAMAYQQTGDRQSARLWYDRATTHLAAMASPPPDLLSIQAEAQGLIEAQQTHRSISQRQ